MKCPICGSENIKVYCGRNENNIYRRCNSCYRTFQTVERVMEQKSMRHMGDITK